MDTTFEKLKALIVERLGVDPEEVTTAASFTGDLGADSLDVVEFVMELEDVFDIEITDEDAEKLQTVQDVLTYIENKAN